MPMFTSLNQTSGFIKSNKSIIPSQARKIPGFIKEQDAGFYSAECVNADEIISAAKLIINRLKRKICDQSHNAQKLPLPAFAASLGFHRAQAAKSPEPPWRFPPLLKTYPNRMESFTTASVPDESPAPKSRFALLAWDAQCHSPA